MTYVVSAYYLTIIYLRLNTRDEIYSIALLGAGNYAAESEVLPLFVYTMLSITIN